MYLATKTAACIGNNWAPTIQEEYLFMTIYWLIGLFIFALLIGQVVALKNNKSNTNNDNDLIMLILLKVMIK